MTTERVTLWRLTWTHDTGPFWLAMGSTHPDSAAHDIARLQRRDAQGTRYHASAKRPPLPDNAQALARHPATWA